MSKTAKDPEDIICPVCGYYCLGRGGFGCIDKPWFVKNKVNPNPRKPKHRGSFDAGTAILLVIFGLIMAIWYINETAAETRVPIRADPWGVSSWYPGPSGQLSDPYSTTIRVLPPSDQRESLAPAERVDYYREYSRRLQERNRR